MNGDGDTGDGLRRRFEDSLLGSIDELVKYGFDAIYEDMSDVEEVQFRAALDFWDVIMKERREKAAKYDE